MSAWLRVSGKNETVSLGIRQKNMQNLTASTSSAEWIRKSIDFKTGPDITEVEIYFFKSVGDGYAWCDNITLPMTP